MSVAWCAHNAGACRISIATAASGPLRAPMSRVHAYLRAQWRHEFAEALGWYPPQYTIVARTVQR